MNDRREYIKEWRKNNPEKVKQYNRDYYLRNKAGLINGKPMTDDKYCPKCDKNFSIVRHAGDFVILICGDCGYQRSFNKDDFYG